MRQTIPGPCLGIVSIRITAGLESLERDGDGGIPGRKNTLRRLCLVKLFRLSLFAVPEKAMNTF